MLLDIVLMTSYYIESNIFKNEIVGCLIVCSKAKYLRDGSSKKLKSTLRKALHLSFIANLSIDSLDIWFLNGCRKYVDIMRGEKLSLFSLLTWT